MHLEYPFRIVPNRPYKYRKNNNDFVICRHDDIVNFLDFVVFLLSNLGAGPSFMSIFLLMLDLWQFLFLRSLTWNPEIVNTPVWVLSIMWRLEWDRDTRFGMNVSNEMLNNAAKFPDYSF